MKALIFKNFRLLILLSIFILGLSLRFLYFPDNVYFAYDQARDSFYSLEVLHGKLKIIGPPSSFNENLSHGPLVYYIFAPILFLSKTNPEGVSAFLRVFNALGILITFAIASILFNKRVGLLSAFLYATAYEQTQYALFFGHPALAVISVLFFYLGLSLFIFKNKWWGLTLAALALGISIQFHYANVLLFIPLIAILIIFRKELINTKKLYLFYPLLAFLISISTFLISELKFHFKFTNAASQELQTLFSGVKHQLFDPLYFLIIIQRSIHDNIINFHPALEWAVFTLILAGIAWIFFKQKASSSVIFLMIWFLGGLPVYILTHSDTYYFNPASSVSLLIIISYLLNLLWSKNRIISIILTSVIISSNLFLITTLNAAGPNKDIMIQPGMLISSEKQAIDYLYKEAGGNPFAISGLTVPLNVNTTWSYLFEWYGRQKYGYLPEWGSVVTAKGYLGNLPINTAKSTLPKIQFIVVEPTIGISDHDQADFFRIEGYFTKIQEEKRFGQILVQKRLAY